MTSNYTREQEIRKKIRNQRGLDRTQKASQETEKSRTDKFFDGLSMIMGRFGMLGSIVSGVTGIFQALKARSEQLSNMIKGTVSKAKNLGVTTAQYKRTQSLGLKSHIRVGETNLNKGLKTARDAVYDIQAGEGEATKFWKDRGVDMQKKLQGKNVIEAMQIMSVEARKIELPPQDQKKLGDILFQSLSARLNPLFAAMGSGLNEANHGALLDQSVNDSVRQKQNLDSEKDYRESLRKQRKENSGIKSNKDDIYRQTSILLSSPETFANALRSSSFDTLNNAKHTDLVSTKSSGPKIYGFGGLAYSSSEEIPIEQFEKDFLKKYKDDEDTLALAKEAIIAGRDNNNSDLESIMAQFVQNADQKRIEYSEKGEKLKKQNNDQPSQHSTAQNAGQGQQGAPVSTGSVATGSVPTGTVMAPLEDSVKKDIADIKEAAQSIDQSIDDKTSELASLESDKGDKAEKDQSKDVPKDVSADKAGEKSGQSATVTSTTTETTVPNEMAGLTQEELIQMHRDAVAAVMDTLGREAVGDGPMDAAAARAAGAATGNETDAEAGEGGASTGIDWLDSIFDTLFGSKKEEEGKEGQDEFSPNSDDTIVNAQESEGDATGGGNEDGKDDGKTGEKPDPKKAGEQTKKAMATILTETKIGNKLLEAEEKRKAIKSAITAMHENVSQAMKAGFPQNIFLMAQAALQGKKQIQAIKGQFHDGVTDVPSTGSYVLEKGERVVPKGLNQDLKGFMASARGRGALGAMGNRSELGRSTLKSAMGLVEDPSALGAARMERSGLSTAKMEGQLSELIKQTRLNKDSGAKTFKNDIQINVAGPMTPENQHEVRQQLKDALNDLYLDHNLVSPFDRDE